MLVCILSLVKNKSMAVKRRLCVPRLWCRSSQSINSSQSHCQLQDKGFTSKPRETCAFSVVDVATGGTNAPCEDNAATILKDKYAYFHNNFEFEDGDKIIDAVKGKLSKRLRIGKIL